MRTTVDKTTLDSVGSMLQKRAEPSQLRDNETFATPAVDDQFALFKVIKNNPKRKEIKVAMFDFDEQAFLDTIEGDDLYISYDDFDGARLFKVMLVPATADTMNRNRLKAVINQIEEILSLRRRLRKLQKEGKPSNKTSQALLSAEKAYNPAKQYEDKQLKWLVQQHWGAIHRSRAVRMRNASVFIMEDNEEYEGILKDIKLDNVDETHATYILAFENAEDEYLFDSRLYSIEDNEVSIVMVRRNPEPQEQSVQDSAGGVAPPKKRPVAVTLDDL